MDLGMMTEKTEKETIINMLDQIINLAYDNKSHLLDINNKIESIPVANDVGVVCSEDYDIFSRLRRIRGVLDDCNGIERNIKEKI